MGFLWGVLLSSQHGGWVPGASVSEGPVEGVSLLGSNLESHKTSLLL